MRRLEPFVLPLTAGVLLAGCSAGEPSSQEGAFQPWSVSAEPSLSIGGSGADVPEDYLLYGVAGATRMSDGTVVIANMGSTQLKYFDAGGRHLRTVGGPGDGPGEMRGVLQVVPWPGDTVMVLSFRPGLTWYGPTGDLVRSTPIDLWTVAQAECRLGESQWHALADGSIVTILEDNFTPSYCPQEPPDPYRQSGLIGRREIETGRFDTLAIMPASDRSAQGEYGRNYRVYGRTLVLGLGQDRIYAGDTGSDVILALGFGGDTLASIPTPFESVPVPESARSRERREWVRPDGTTMPGDPYVYPELYPRFARLLVARTRELWVMAYPEMKEPVSSWQFSETYAFVVPDAGARWRVMSPSGEPVAEVRTPPRFYVLEVGADYVLGVSKDEFDVESVEQYALVR